MERLCTIEFWFKSQYIQGVVFRNKQTAFSEYLVTLLNPNWYDLVQGYFFIEGYDGSLELNKAPESFLQKEFLEEMGQVIKNIQQQLSYNKVNTIPDHKVSFINCSQSDISPTPSAAA